MIDVFVCTIGGRDEMLARVMERWQEEGGANVTLLTPEQVGADAYQFQRARRQWADNHTRSNFYVVADDDCLPQTGAFLREAVSILENHLEFAQLSLRPDRAEIVPWNPGPHEHKHRVGGVVHVDEDVQEHVSVGGVRFCRKGVISNWMEMPKNTTPGYDSIQAMLCRDRGFRVGYYQSLYMTHLGSGKSQIWPHWKAKS